MHSKAHLSGEHRLRVDYGQLSRLRTVGGFGNSFCDPILETAGAVSCCCQGDNGEHRVNRSAPQSPVTCPSGPLKGNQAALPQIRQVAFSRSLRTIEPINHLAYP